MKGPVNATNQKTAPKNGWNIFHLHTGSVELSHSDTGFLVPSLTRSLKQVRQQEES